MVLKLLRGTTSQVIQAVIDAASMFTEGISRFINNQRAPSYYKTFSSDYALYWYDYQAGYDTVFAELGWNYSRQINIALCRAAAAANNGDWGGYDCLELY